MESDDVLLSKIEIVIPEEKEEEIVQEPKETTEPPEKPFQCPYCDKSYIRESGLKKHLEVIHPTENENEDPINEQKNIFAEKVKNMFNGNVENTEPQKQISAKAIDFIFEGFIMLMLSIQGLYNYFKDYFKRIMEDVDKRVRAREETYKELIFEIFQETENLDEIAKISSDPQIQFLTYMSLDLVNSIRDMSLIELSEREERIKKKKGIEDEKKEEIIETN